MSEDLVHVQDEIVLDDIPVDPASDMVLAIKRVLDKWEPYKEDYFREVDENVRRLEDFETKPKSIPENSPPFLVVLRQWNSYTPVLPARCSNRGGGYFLYYNGYGLVIDPGYNFIQNFLEFGFMLSDINGILISHAHNDHSVELESLFSLLYRKNRKVDQEHQEHQKIDLFLNLGSFKKYASFFDLSYKEQQPTYLNKIVLLNPHQEYYIGSPDEDFSFFTTETKHHEMITSTYALGFFFKCGNKIIRFTSDTGWSSEIENRNEKMLDSYGLVEYNSVDLLVAHLGSIKKQEFDYDYNVSLDQNENNAFYQNHLGLLGCICMMKKWRPSLTVLSEFGEEIGNLRNILPHVIGEPMGMTVISADIGLCIKLDDLNIHCQKSGHFVDSSDIKTRIQDNKLVYISDNLLREIERPNLSQIVNELTPVSINDSLKLITEEG